MPPKEPCPSCDGFIEQIGQLEQAIVSRDVIGQAKGLLMATMNCRSEDAFDLLVEHSQRTNVPLREVAQTLVARHEEVARG